MKTVQLLTAPGNTHNEIIMRNLVYDSDTVAVSDSSYLEEFRPTVKKIYGTIGRIWYTNSRA